MGFSVAAKLYAQLSTMSKTRLVCSAARAPSWTNSVPCLVAALMAMLRRRLICRAVIPRLRVFVTGKLEDNEVLDRAALEDLGAAVPRLIPGLLLRILLIGYLYGITSERKLVEELRGFTGLGFDQEIPHHSKMVAVPVVAANEKP